MKILAISNLYPPDCMGGYEMGCQQAVEALRERGHQVHVLAGAPQRPVPTMPGVQRDLHLSNLMYLPAVVQESRTAAYLSAWARGAFVDAHNIHVLLEALDEFRPDAIYLWNLFGLGGLGILATLSLMDAPWVFHLMDSIPSTLCSLGPNPLRGLGREFSRMFEGRFLACSQALVDEIGVLGFPLGENVEILPNWVDGNRHDQRRPHLQDGKLRIAMVSFLGKHKGVDLLIDAAAVLRDRGHANFQVDIYGPGDAREYCSAIHRSQLHPYVALKGERTRETIRALLRGYDVFAFPTWEREPFGFVALEAAAEGCVPVVTAGCGFAEWLVHGVHCLKAERSAEAFADTFQDILDGRVDLAAIARRGMNTVWSEFHIRRLVPRIERALLRSRQERAWSPARKPDVYRLAVLAERLVQVLTQQTLSA